MISDNDEKRIRFESQSQKMSHPLSLLSFPFLIIICLCFFKHLTNPYSLL